jgi:hypothetical protein
MPRLDLRCVLPCLAPARNDSRPSSAQPPPTASRPVAPTRTPRMQSRLQREPCPHVVAASAAQPVPTRTPPMQSCLQREPCPHVVAASAAQPAPTRTPRMQARLQREPCPHVVAASAAQPAPTRTPRMQSRLQREPCPHVVAASAAQPAPTRTPSMQSRLQRKPPAPPGGRRRMAAGSPAAGQHRWDGRRPLRAKAVGRRRAGLRAGRSGREPEWSGGCTSIAQPPPTHRASSLSGPFANGPGALSSGNHSMVPSAAALAAVGRVHALQRVL